jgi:hypothetical protein
MMRFNRWLSSSSLSRGFFEETLGRTIVSPSSRAPISLKFLKADFAEFGSADLAEFG